MGIPIGGEVVVVVVVEVLDVDVVLICEASVEVGAGLDSALAPREPVFEHPERAMRPMHSVAPRVTVRERCQPIITTIQG